MPVVQAPITPAQAAAELLRRRRARGRLAYYAQSIDIPGAPLGEEEDPQTEVFKTVETTMAAHHLLICDAVQECIETFGGRLIIMAPPGSAKSSYVSVVTPPWAMGRWSGFRTILAGYGVDLAVKQSRRARNVCRQKKHTSIFPGGRLTEDQRAADEWKLANDSEFMAAGFQTGITGNRADLLLVDDPVKNREDADSPTIRAKTADEFRDSAQTRLKPGGSIVIIMTRWHEDDLVGSILPENYAGESGYIACRDGQTWRVINLPAKAEHMDDPLGRKPGEYLWPQWFPPSHWAIWENNPRAARTWSALFQQRPSPESGLQFQRSKVRWYDPDMPWRADREPGTPGFGTEDNPACCPRTVRQYGASDYATTDDGGDFTEHGLFGIDHKGQLFGRDWWSGQRETDVSIAAWNSMVARHRHDKDSAQPVVKWWNEGGPIDKAIKPAINRSMQEYPDQLAWVAVETMVSVKDKAVKLASFHARWNAGMVWLPIRRDWAQQLVDQLVKFPTGKFDDKCDVCGLVGRGIDKMGNAAVPSPIERRPGLKPFTKEWLEWEPEQPPSVRYYS